MSIYIDHLQLAASYVDYLLAIAGASLTVLTLVIAFESNPTSGKLHPMLVSSLIVAVLASFVGTHLMSGVAALELRDQTVIEKGIGLRFFLLSFVNVDIASNCFMMSMLLLVPAFQPELAKILVRLISLVFVCMIGGQVLWTCDEIFVHAQTYHEGFSILGVSGFIGIMVFFLIRNKLKTPEIYADNCQTPFFICTLVSTISILINMMHTTKNDIPMIIVLYVFGIGSSVVYGSVSSAGWLTISKVLRHDYENIGVIIESKEKIVIEGRANTQ